MIRFRRRGSPHLYSTLLRSVPARGPDGSVLYAINFLREVTDAVRRDDQRGFLLRAVDALNSSLDYEQTLATITRVAVPDLADWCAVDLLRADAVHRVAVAHIDPAKLELVTEIERRYPTAPDAATGVPQIIRSGQTEFVPDIPYALIERTAIDEEHLPLISSLQLRSYLGVPLTVRGVAIGAITFAMAESGRRYTEMDREFVEGLAERAALAIDNARLVRELERANAATQELLAAEQARRTEAERASQFADLFVGILGHDLRNPLNAVTLGVDLLASRGSDEKLVQRIRNSTNRMQEMVSQLLDLARTRLGDGISIVPKAQDLAVIVAHVVDEMRLAYPARRIDLSTAETFGPWDGDRLAQVVSNLVGNALEHGTAGRPVAIIVEHDAERARLSVHNDGSPIPATLLPQLFDPYRRTATRGAALAGSGWACTSRSRSWPLTAGRSRSTRTPTAGPRSRSSCRSASAASNKTDRSPGYAGRRPGRTCRDHEAAAVRAAPMYARSRWHGA
ncbi:hypothetical protein BH11MYX1_BH11MYX1_42200 [soil metagenome]